MSTSFTPSELIELFLDGEATADERRALFDALGRDSALKTEFDDALRLRSAIARDSAIPPAAVLGTAVFAAIDAIDQPASTASAIPSAAPSAAGVVAASIVGRVLAVAAAALIVGETAYIYLHHEPAVVFDAPRPLAAPTAHAAEPAPVDHSGDVGNLRPLHHSLTPAAPRPVRGTVPPVAWIAAVEDSTARISSIIAPLRAVPAVPLAYSLMPEHRPVATERIGMLAALPDEQTADALWTERLTAQLRGVSMVLPQADKSIDNPERRLFNDLLINVGYALSPDAAVGASIGRETFPVAFEHPDSKHRERPAMIWGGATYRWSPSSMTIASTIQPFGMGTAGGGEFGPLFRAELGAEWRPDVRTSFTLGVEAVGVGYTNNQLFYGASKVSLVYGVSLRF